MVSQSSVCLRQLALGRRKGIVGYGRFLANENVTVEALIEGWGLSASQACAGRHVLAIQDTSEFCFRTTSEHSRGLGEIGKGRGRGLLLHAMLGVDAETGGLLGLVSGDIWTRKGRVETSHNERTLPQKESQRWVTTAEVAKGVLAPAGMVTELSDRESDFFAKWALVPESNFHILTRAMRDRRIVEGGGTLSTAPLMDGSKCEVVLRERHGRAARTAHLKIRYGRVTLKSPIKTIEEGLPDTVEVSLVEVVEVNPPADVEAISWQLLTTHPVEDDAKAWTIVGWYRQRWIIEQFFRTLKQQGLQVEDSQVEDGKRLIKLTAIAAHAAVIIMQLVQARDGQSQQSADLAFTPSEIQTLEALVPQLEGKTQLQKNPHPKRSLAWAAWVIAKLGGWDGYPKSTPPGPVTFKNGLKTFHAMARGWKLREV